MNDTCRLRLHVRLFAHFMLVSAALTLLVLPSRALGKQPIRIIYPFPAGGAGDSIIRLLAERIQAGLDRTVLVDNRSGGAVASACRPQELQCPTARPCYSQLSRRCRSISLCTPTLATIQWLTSRRLPKSGLTSLLPRSDRKRQCLR